MRFSKVLSPIFAVLFLISLLAGEASALPESPPKLTVDATPNQLVVTVSGTVSDPDGDVVQVTIKSTGFGPGIETEVPVIDGHFSVDVHISFGQEALVVTATDENGQTDSEIVELEF